MRRSSRLVVMSLPVLLALALVGHFGLTLAYLTPTNPLRLRFARVINAYMNPFFQQNWHLFAPDPINDTRTLMLSCRVRQPDGGTVETPWTDITIPYWEAHLGNHFGPATRIARSVTGPARLVYSGDPTTLQIKKKVEQHKKNGPADDSLDEMADSLDDAVKKEQEENFKLGADVLSRAGSAHCDSLYGRGRTEAVRVRMAVLKFPRFSRRDLPDEKGDMTYYDFDWAPYQEVAPPEPARDSGDTVAPVSRAGSEEGK
ncbi:MAG: DUF5819 family protein [Minicystis sp.]